ncbi:LptF/LptG family permease [Planctomycetes bacterium K23_9]|uniref:Putative permease YjgP/YjgQ family protein n=1 Tax=Stieleria marina TaxID=1930275 RepID=A0A517NXC3_9BACT|nr:putative permease YjgP/YjgQ family protein [Planctomycetes bacterium K23_9]
MPSRLTRYMLAEILKIFVVALIALTMMILLIGVGRTLLREGLGPLAILKLLPFLLPIALQHAFPATALFAVSCVFGRMAADGEVSTVKATGVSPLRLLQTPFIFALLLSPGAVWLSDIAVSWGQPGVNRVVMLSIEDIVYRKLGADCSYTDHGFSIHVREVNGRDLMSPMVTVHNGGDKGPVKLSAKKGSLSLDPQSHMLLLKLTDSEISGGTSLQGYLPGEDVFQIPLSKTMEQKSTETQRPRELPLRMIRRERLKQDERTHAAVGELAAQTGFAILTARHDEIAGAEGRSVMVSLEASKKRLLRLQIEPWRRWAEGFSCFFFVLIGAPLAVIVKSSDYWTTFGMCFLPILLLYYPLFIFGLEQAKDGVIPPYGVWIGNIALGGIGMMLIARVRRY